MSDIVKLVTPVGELFHSFISGKGKQNYNEDGYDYCSSIRLTAKESEQLRADIDAQAVVPKGKTLKSVGYKELYIDKENKLYFPKQGGANEGDKPSGIFQFNFKTSVAFPDGTTKVIAVYNKDAKKILLGNKRLGNGSKGAISGAMELTTYKQSVSVSLYLNALQVTVFEEYTEDAGFGEQEGEFDGVEDAESGFTGQPEDDTPKEKPKL